jgi:hypothetical protein
MDITLINESHLKPTNKWRKPAYIIYRTEGRRPQHEGTAVAIKSSIHHNQATLPQFAALEAATISILTGTETLTIGAVYTPPSRPLLAQDLTILTQCSQHIFAGDYNAKHQMWHSRLTNARGGTLYDHNLQCNYDVIGRNTPTHFPVNYNHPPDALDIAIIRTTAVPVHIKSVEVLSCDHNPVLLVMEVEPLEHTTRKMDPFTINWAYYRQLLQQAIPGNTTLTSIEEIDAAITIFTPTIKSAKNGSKLYHAYPPREPAIPNLEKLLRRKRRTRKNMHHFNRAVDRQQCNFLKNYTQRRLQHSRILKFKKEVENASATNNIWKMTKGPPNARHTLAPQ